MEFNSSTLLAVIFGMILLLLFLVLAFVIFRAVLRKPSGNPPLVPTADGHFEVDGKRVSCAHCRGKKFTAKEILLNTWLLSLLRIDWLDSSATVLSCKKCGQLTWFSLDE
jgi:predicted nucleic-acid-binding Zn-ribbon protein